MSRTEKMLLRIVVLSQSRGLQHLAFKLSEYKWLRFILLMVVVPSFLAGQSAAPSAEIIQGISKFRDHLMSLDKTDHFNLKQLAVKCSESNATYHDLKYAFTEVNHNIAANEMDYFQIQNKLNNYNPRDFDGWNFSLLDIKLISDHHHLLELVWEEVLKPTYPFALNPASPIFKELDFYNLSTAENIAEVGAGSGLFSFLLSTIYSEQSFTVNELGEINFNSLRSFANDYYKAMRTKMVEVVKGEKTEVNLETAAYDKILIRDSFHHFKKKKKMLQSIKGCLKPEGYLYLYEPIKSRGENTCSKAMEEEKILKMMKSAGYQLLKSEKLNDSMLFQFRVKEGL